jgi:23S rRNA (guanosine2251-2'-O)-methyltransferase
MYSPDIHFHVLKQAELLDEAGRLATPERLNNALANCKAINKPLIAVVEDVRSLWNVGSIFRSADGAGFGLLLLCGITGTPPRKEIAKTSLGAEESVNWLYAPSVSTVAQQIKEAGCTVIALEVAKGLPDIPDSVELAAALKDADLPQPLCLIVGNEVKGISKETLLACDRICHLPMRGMKESLNVAVAFGIAAYMIAQRG